MQVKKLNLNELTRKNMVQRQLRSLHVTSPEILKIFSIIDREFFVPARAISVAYSDHPIYCEVPGRYMFPAYTTASIFQYLNLLPDTKVLLVGCNYGYLAALLSALYIKPDILESNTLLAEKCQENLKEYSIEHVLHQAPLDTEISLEYFDLIIAEICINHIPQSFISQLNENGRLVVCLSQGQLSQVQIFTKRNKKLHIETSFATNMPVSEELLSMQSFVL